MSNIPVYQYIEMHNSNICLTICKYEYYVKQKPETHGVKWVYKSCYPPEVTVRKRRNLYCSWTTYYKFYSAGIQRENKTIPRSLKKFSKKVGCMTQFVVSYRPDE
ncbi:MAG: hypothetical protein EXX96DRAFT_538573 [Benjaminiella poitrasii]|nr:MAG: hypothetical protein EXX96DRAFT_538573 [Benjaminiella poitrasii]